VLRVLNQERVERGLDNKAGFKGLEHGCWMGVQ
jgi:hypothetical protein